jgi:hypothetical protein
MPATSHPGKAITIVLLPGMDGTGKLFAGFVAALGDAAKALVPDRHRARRRTPAWAGRSCPVLQLCAHARSRFFSLVPTLAAAAAAYPNREHGCPALDRAHHACVASFRAGRCAFIGAEAASARSAAGGLLCAGGQPRPAGALPSGPARQGRPRFRVRPSAGVDTVHASCPFCRAPLAAAVVACCRRRKCARIRRDMSSCISLRFSFLYKIPYAD